MEGPSLESCLDLIPENKRRRLDDKLDEGAVLVNIARSIANWELVANYLLGGQDIHAVKQDYGNSLELQQIGLLKRWKMKNGHEATYRRLAQALFKAGAVDSVHTLCQELGAPPSNPPVHPTPSQTAQHISKQPLLEHGGASSPIHVEPQPSPSQPENKTTFSSTPSSLTGSSKASSVPAFNCSATVSARILKIAKAVSHLQDSFMTVILYTKICFAKKAKPALFLKIFKITIKTLPLSNKYKHLHFLREDIKMAKDIEEIWDILDPHWDWRDYALLEWIIKEFGTSELQKEMKEYIEELEQFEKTTSVEDYNSATQIKPSFLHSEDPHSSLYKVRELENDRRNLSALAEYGEKISFSSEK